MFRASLLIVSLSWFLSGSVISIKSFPKMTLNEFKIHLFSSVFGVCFSPFDNFMEKHAQIELSGNTELLSGCSLNLLK